MARGVVFLLHCQKVRRSSPVLMLSIGLLLSGCAFRPQSVSMAIDHNDFVAETTNSQTVLNILRAREREPMHFTSFSKIAGNVAATGAVSANVLLNGDGGSAQKTTAIAAKSGPGDVLIDQTVTGQDVAGTTLGATNVTPQLSLQVNTGTNFDIAVNANDDFYKGILGTLPNSLLVHYLRQGFPADLLSHLTIGRLEFYAEVTGPNGFAAKPLMLDIRNAPDESEQVSVFAQAMKCRRLSYAPDPQAAKSLPLINPDALSGVAPELIVRLKGAVEKAPYSLETPARNDFKIALSEPTADCQPIREYLATLFQTYAEGKEIYDPNGGGRTTLPPSDKLLTTTADFLPSDRNLLANSEDLRGQGGATFQAQGFFNRYLKDGYTGDLVIELSFRSIEGVIYYLGEYARNSEPTPKLKGPKCAGDGYCLPIIKIGLASDIQRDRQWVNVRYRGKRYAVPISGAELDEVGGRSSQTVSLVQQLLNLTKTAKDLPSTPSVRIVN